MHVFITGGSGLIGRAVIAELTAHDHRVTALARSDRSAAAVTDAGARPVHGSLTDLDTLRSQAGEADGVIHLAFTNDFSSMDAVLRSVDEETVALAAMGEALVHTGRPFVTVSGTPATPGRASVESDPTQVEGPVGGRGRAVEAVLALAEQGVRASAVRLPRTVHRDGTGGFAGLLTQIARRDGVSGHTGDGSQRWPAVHALDAAALFRLALEDAPAGTRWHAVADEGDRVRDIAAVIGRRLGVPVQSIPEEAYGPLGTIFALDQPSSSAQTRDALGWQPTHPSLLDDLELVTP